MYLITILSHLQRSLEKYKASHDTALLMKTIGTKERTPDDFWAAREEGWYSPTRILDSGG